MVLLSKRLFLVIVGNKPTGFASRSPGWNHRNKSLYKCHIYFGIFISDISALTFSKYHLLRSFSDRTLNPVSFKIGNQLEGGSKYSLYSGS